MQRKVLLYDKSGEEHLQPHLGAAQIACARATPTPRSTGWRACWRRAKTACTSRAAWCAWPSRTSAWPTRARSSRPSPRMQAVHFLGIPEGDLALAQAAIYLSRRAQVRRRLPRAGRGPGGRAEDHRRAGAAAPAQRAHRGHEGVGLRRGLPARARVRRRHHATWSACRPRWPAGAGTSPPSAAWRSASRERLEEIRRQERRNGARRENA